MDSSNKQIIRNSIFLYIRMLLVMTVTLYTSRVVLEVLGVTDYGIYSIVGGVIVIFTFINQAMATATQRYITFELGKKNGNVSDVLSASIVIHFIMAIIIIIMGETVGLWFINNQMNFPEKSMYAVNWTYQMTIIGCVISIMQFPFNSLILAQEKMDFFAYTGIIEVILRLAIVYLLMSISSNKLIFYAILMTIVSLILLIWYIIYCNSKFPEIKIHKISKKSTILEISKFSGWAMFGSAANVGYQQGINVILNIFYGVSINAAVGIANQVNSAVTRFVSSFQQAINPQLIKNEASNSKERQISLIESSAKFSFLIMLFISYPLMINLNYIVSIWLVTVPPMTISICQLIIIGALIETISGPLWVSIFATGNIKTYQIVISIILLLNIPLSYMSSYTGESPTVVFLIRILLFIVALFIRLLFLKHMIGLNITAFTRKVLAPISTIICSLGIITFSFRDILYQQADFNSALFSILVSLFITGVLIYSIGLNPKERNTIASLINAKIHKSHP